MKHCMMAFYRTGRLEFILHVYERWVVFHLIKNVHVYRSFLYIFFRLFLFFAAETCFLKIKITLKQVGYISPFGGLSPNWWLNAQIVYLFQLPNGIHFLFIADYVFVKKRRIVFTTGAITLTCFFHNNTFVLKILWVDFFRTGVQKMVQMYASRKWRINKVFLFP